LPELKQECEHINSVYPKDESGRIIAELFDVPVSYWQCSNCGMISGDLEDFGEPVKRPESGWGYE